MPLDYAENDVNPIDLPLQSSPGGFLDWDPNPFFGRVVYTHALGIDRPQSIIRMAYRTRMDTTRKYPLTNLLDFAPIPIVPLWDARGQPDIGMFAHVGAADNCQTVNNHAYCSRIIWPGKYFAYDRPPGNPLYWHGSLIDDKKDPVGTHYRRNRYYDPKAGRFTQEDPIGLAGGLNLYGFAGGDPVNYSDPFGLCVRADGKEDTECERFAKYIEQLARESKSDEEFIRKLGEFVAGLEGGRAEGRPGAPAVTFGASGFRKALVDDRNPARHYSAYVVLANQKGGAVGSAVAVIREMPGYWQAGCSGEDIRLGLIGADHGARLIPDGQLINYGISGPTRFDLAKWIRTDL